MTQASANKETAPKQALVVDVTVVGGAGHVGIPLALSFANKGLRVMINDLNEQLSRNYKPGTFPSSAFRWRGQAFSKPEKAEDSSPSAGSGWKDKGLMDSVPGGTSETGLRNRKRPGLWPPMKANKTRIERHWNPLPLNFVFSSFYHLGRNTSLCPNIHGVNH